MKRNRCKSCGRFIRNGLYCKPCVDSYRSWKSAMDSYGYIGFEGRKEILATMEKECEKNV